MMENHTMLLPKDTTELKLSVFQKKSHISVIILSFLLVVATFVTPKEARGQQPNACELLTRDDADKILGATVSAGVSRTTMMPAGQSCRYTYQMNGSVYGVTLRITTDSEIKEEGLNDSAADLMSKQKKARAGHAYAATTFKEITGLSDDAFWNGTDLWVLKGRLLFIVKSNAYLSGTFKNKDEAKQAAETRNLQISLDIAKVVMSGL
jgi:hypothetical protein